MKRTINIIMTKSARSKAALSAMAFCLITSTVTAQNNDTVELNEVTVNGVRTVTKQDFSIIYPTEEQKKAATTGYGLLHCIALPEIRVNETERSITALSLRGAVHVRVNGIEATTQELLSMDCEAVERIEYTDRPGVRYGEDVGYVINIITRRAERGYTLGTNLTNGMNAAEGKNAVFTRINRGKNQWEATGDFGYSDVDTDRNSETARYTMNDNTVCTMDREYATGHTKQVYPGAILTYNHIDSGHYVLQARLSTSMQRSKYKNGILTVTTDGETEQSESGGSYKTWSPTADIYWQRDIDKQRMITANIMATGIFSGYDHNDNENGPYAFHAKGRTWSLTGEAIYESRMKPFTLSARCDTA